MWSRTSLKVWGMEALLLSCILVISSMVPVGAATELFVKRGTDVVLSSASVDQVDQVNSVMWNKDKVTVVTINADKEVKFSMPDLETRARVNMSALQLTNVRMEDSGSWVSQMSVTITQDTAVVDYKLREMNYTLIVQDVPSAPSRPSIMSIQSRQAMVVWTDGLTDNNSPIESYKVIVRECNNPGDQKTIDETTYQKLLVQNLSPFTCYTISVIAKNAVGDSSPSVPSVEFYTEQEALTNIMSDQGNLLDNTTDYANVTTTDPPTSAPLNFKARSVSSTEIVLQWNPPPEHMLNGELKGYKIKYGIGELHLKTFLLEDPDSTNYTLKGLRPYTAHHIHIMAYNSAGDGPDIATVETTLEGVPSVPRITHLSERTHHSFYVNWQPPQYKNGELTRYVLQWGLENQGDNVTSRFIKGHLMKTMTAYIKDLTPFTFYFVRVAAETKAGRGDFTNNFPALTDVAAPSPPRNLNITVVQAHSLRVSWDKPAIIYRQIDNYLIKGWDHMGRNYEQLVRGHLTEYILRNLPTNTRYRLKVAAITNAMFDNKSWVGDFTDVVSVTLGDPSLYAGHDDSSIHPGIIVGVVLAVALALVVVALVVGYRWYTCRKCYQAAYTYLRVPNNGQSVQTTILPVEEPSEEKQYPDIAVEDFIQHVKDMHADSDIGFSQEFDEINRTTKSDKYLCESSNAPDNRNKNRYINIVAYDHSRVILKTEMARMRQSDYINANYVDGYKKPKAYIATQGPLPHTFADFWRMVWEQNTNVIVMITNLMEKGRRKCDQYWPGDSTETYGNMTVKLLTTVPRAHYTVRVFSLRNMKVKKRHSMKASAERTVYHYHYTEWPDHGVPDFSLPVLAFVQKSAAQSRPENGPIIVHCSAGVGRTGTYILIDSMIAQVQDKRSINIPGFTQHIRRQRNFLVQTEDQYIFIHSVLVEYLLGGGSTEVREERLQEYLTCLSQPAQGYILNPFSECTLLEKQHQLITDYTPSKTDLSAALKPCNIEKNRQGSILPVNLKRVYLPARPGVEGSDYINATYLQGYKKSSEFMVTQHPTEDTMEDFWRMVWDKNSPVIVVLSAIDDIEYKEFWPPQGNSIDVDAGNFRLAMKDHPFVEAEKGYSTYEFILESIQYDYTLLTHLVCVENWPQAYTDSHRVFDAIAHARAFVNSIECGPIIVMDRFGGQEAGQFCALWTLRDQIQSEKCADFYQLAKLYHLKRPGIIGLIEDYSFIHRAMATLSRHMQEELANGGTSPRHHHHFDFFHHGSSRRNGTLPRSHVSGGGGPTSNTLPRTHPMSQSDITDKHSNSEFTDKETHGDSTERQMYSDSTERQMYSDSTERKRHSDSTDRHSHSGNTERLSHIDNTERQIEDGNSYTVTTEENTPTTDSETDSKKDTEI